MNRNTSQLNKLLTSNASVLALIGFFLMLSFQSFWLGEFGHLYSPVVWLIGSIMLFFGVWFDLQKTNSSQPRIKVSKSHSRIISMIVMFVALLLLSLDMNSFFKANPIDAAQSDVIPSLEFYARRLLSGEQVYKPMPFANYEVWPTYFPMMWLPYIVPEYLGFDYRWMAFFSFNLTFIYIIWSSLAEEDLMLLLLKCILPFLSIYLIKVHDPSVFAFAVELMPITYYLWLVWGLLKKNFFVIGLALAFCTMSRYAYSLWIIPFVVIIWRELGFVDLLKIATVGLVAVLVLYVIPFLLPDPNILRDGLKYYGTTANAEWQTQFWQEPGSIPYHLGRGLTMAIWSYEFVDGDYLAKLAVAKKIQFTISLLLSIISTFVYIMLKPKISWNKYLILTLFLYVAVFYSFIYVAFSYLYLLPLFLGLMLLVIFLWSKENLGDKPFVK